ncbi:MAG: thioredoxin family protein [Candidatus Aenigmarchaeota archaeon]|nr:thioredoxin family protein [Candidatus Aenigmarchaeota archaeon]
MPEDLLEFYGEECGPCIEMRPLIEKLEKEEGVKVTGLEVWHNAKNLEILRKYDKGRCGGVPFFFNKKTGEWICGSTGYEDLKRWALGG